MALLYNEVAWLKASDMPFINVEILGKLSDSDMIALRRSATTADVKSFS
jgi:hypothetical protein